MFRKQYNLSTLFIWRPCHINLHVCLLFWTTNCNRSKKINYCTSRINYLYFWGWIQKTTQFLIPITQVKLAYFSFPRLFTQICESFSLSVGGKFGFQLVNKLIIRQGGAFYWPKNNNFLIMSFHTKYIWWWWIWGLRRWCWSVWWWWKGYQERTNIFSQ